MAEVHLDYAALGAVLADPAGHGHRLAALLLTYPQCGLIFTPDHIETGAIA